MNVVVLGLSITSSWGNGHATTYRGLLREFARRGHEVTFLERDVPWYAAHRDLPNPVFTATRLYHGLDELERHHALLVAAADAVILGSYVPDGVAVGGGSAPQPAGSSPSTTSIRRSRWPSSPAASTTISRPP